MLRRPALKFPGLPAVLSFILIAASAPNAEAQAARAQLAENIDAFTLLKQVGQRYANTAYYRIEAVSEEQMDADFSKNWSKSVTTAVLAPGNKYRFEAHANWEWWVLVSDGKLEWLYSPAGQEYKEQAAPIGGSHFESSGLRSFFALTKAQDTIKDLAELPSSVRVASYLPDETLTLNGKQVSCYVIDAQGKYLPGWTPDTTSLSTIWIDKENHLIRKLHQHMEGPLIMGQPQEYYVNDKTTVYSTVELGAPVVPDSFFAFAPPSTAKLVKEFENPTRTQRDALSVGKPAPDVSLKSPDGEKVSLKSFQGRPVLLDFWATWCGPCVESMPSISRLYVEAAKYGLLLLSIDEDEDADKATDFLSKNKEPWQNFHDDGEIVRLFPNEGIPHFVLIDSTGKVVFSKSSFDESEIRAAVAGLGAEFASISKTSQP